MNKHGLRRRRQHRRHADFRRFLERKRGRRPARAELLNEDGDREELENRDRVRFLKARGLLHGTGGDTVAVLEAVLAFLSESAAEIVLVNLEDLWLASRGE